MIRLSYTVSLALLVLGMMGLQFTAPNSPNFASAFAPAILGLLMLFCSLFASKMSKPIGLSGAAVVALVGVIRFGVTLRQDSLDFQHPITRLALAALLVSAYFWVRASLAFMKYMRERKSLR